MLRPTSSRGWHASAAAPGAPDATRIAARPLDDIEFAARLAASGPFERCPRLAIAVSGGADSLALCLLATSWARARGGTVIALIVDHGLRPESAAEARRTAGWLSARAIESEILTWRGAKPATGIQAAARDARYRLLAAACRAQGALHLLLGHHRDDQAETLALRAGRGSGPDGLAGMPVVRELEGCRVLRPLLGIAAERLVATLEQAGQSWVDDPSNRSARFARARIRLGGRLDAPGLASLAAENAARRAALDREVAAWLAAHARIDPAGYVCLAAEPLACAPAEIRHRAVQQALACIGARPYPPRQASLRPLLDQVRTGLARGRTLAGCRVLPWRGCVLVCRESGAIDHVAPLVEGEPLLWDRRFRVAAEGDVAGTHVRALGVTGMNHVRRLSGAGRAHGLPAPVRPGLPSIWRDDRLLAVPGCGVVEPSFACRARVVVRFQPRAALAGATFAGAGEPPTPLLRERERLC